MPMLFEKDTSGIPRGVIIVGLGDYAGSFAIEAFDKHLRRAIGIPAIYRAKKAFHAFGEAVWTKQMRWLSSCTRLLQRVSRKCLTNKDKRVAVEIFRACLLLRKLVFRILVFLRKRVVAHLERFVVLQQLDVFALVLEEFRAQLRCNRLDLAYVLNVDKELDKIEAFVKKNRKSDFCNHASNTTTIHA